ncbi:MAG: hypothetical protein M0R75_14680 [Dehalococcoidia bacterium]|nr:hypothetical protein [Dehalococcoidia bacterium]
MISTRNLLLMVAGLTLAVTMVAAAPSAPARPGAFVRATACLTPSDSSRVRITWTIPTAGTSPIASYGVGLAAGGDTIVSSTVPADAPRAVESAVPCPAYGASVELSASVLAIDASGLAGAPGRASLTLTTAQPVPPGTPEVTIDTLAAAPETPGTLDIGVTGGIPVVLAVCDGDVCDLTWNHTEYQTGPTMAPPAYAVWLVEGDPDAVELPVWPESADPVEMGGVVAYPVSQGACAYPVLPRGPAPQLHACRTYGAPESGDTHWMVTWSLVDVEPIPEETPSVGLATISDLRVVRTAPTALALEWTQVSDGAGGAADYGVRWSTPDGWSPVVAVLGSEVGEPIGYTAVGLQAASAVTVQVSPFRGQLLERAVVGIPAEITVQTAAGRTPPAPLALR